MLDAVWLVPAIAVAVFGTLAYLVGVEVGRDRGRREQQARDRHPSVRSRKIRSTADYWGHPGDGTFIK